jgi:hypothetical protein
MKTLSTLLSIFTLLFIAACANNQSMQLAESDDDEFGIGGTGIMAGNQQGSGIIGMITGYGSIFVNGIEVETENKATISIDGIKVKDHDFEIGEVVEVLSKDTKAHTQAQHINIRHEIIGPVSHYDSGKKTAIILGQTIQLSETVSTGFDLGDTLAVSGFTDPAGLIHATHIKHTTDKPILLRNATKPEEHSLPYNMVAKWVIQGYTENYASQWNIKSANIPGQENHLPVIFEVTNPNSESATIKLLSPQQLLKGSRYHSPFQRKGIPNRSMQPGRQSGSGGHGRK